MSKSLPPVLELVATEPLKEKTYAEAASWLRALRPELHRQAEWSIESYNDYVDQTGSVKPTDFVASPVSGMNPFSRFGKCNEVDCRISNAKAFARTLGLYSDRILLPDPFTTRFLGDGKWDASQEMSFLTDVLVLQELMPLIEAEVIQFVDPRLMLCSDCYAELESEVDMLAQSLAAEFSDNLYVESTKSGWLVDTASLYDPPIHQGLEYRQPRKRAATRREVLRQFFGSVAGEIEEILIATKCQSGLSSAVFSNSRIALTAMNRLEGKSVHADSLKAWELAHSATLPWIGKLSVDQIVTLRQEASKALPLLREKLATSVGPYSNSAAKDDDSARETVRELREQAAEVAAELGAINIPRTDQFHNVAGVLGLTIAVYGFGADLMAPMAALGTLMTTLGLIHTASKKDHQEQDKLVSKPGYVFVKAQEILAHAS